MDRSTFFAREQRVYHHVLHWWWQMWFINNGLLHPIQIVDLAEGLVSTTDSALVGRARG